jgi:hypothetical protein
VELRRVDHVGGHTQRTAEFPAQRGHTTGPARRRGTGRCPGVL